MEDNKNKSSLSQFDKVNKNVLISICLKLEDLDLLNLSLCNKNTCKKIFLNEDLWCQKTHKIINFICRKRLNEFTSNKYYQYYKELIEYFNDDDYVSVLFDAIRFNRSDIVYLIFEKRKLDPNYAFVFREIPPVVPNRKIYNSLGHRIEGPYEYSPIDMIIQRSNYILWNYFRNNYLLDVKGSWFMLAVKSLTLKSRPEVSQETSESLSLSDGSDARSGAAKSLILQTRNDGSDVSYSFHKTEYENLSYNHDYINSLQIFKDLLEYGVDPDIKLLEFAIRLNNKEAVQLLLNLNESHSDSSIIGSANYLTKLEMINSVLNDILFRYNHEYETWFTEYNEAFEFFVNHEDTKILFENYAQIAIVFEKGQKLIRHYLK